jgi:6-phosphogluconate dehydrogenase
VYDISNKEVKLMRIGFVGLGKMGAQIVTKLLADGHQVVVTDINADAVAAMAQAGATPAKNRAELVSLLPGQAIIWLMIPSNFVGEELDRFAELLPAGSVLIDGGNSDFRLTVQRSGKLAAKNITLIDVGTSGGILGLTNGFSMMVGGPTEAVETIASVLDTLAAPRGAHHHFGGSGAGHYVKMVHNGIEYSLMQAYAEGYQLLAEGPVKQLDLAAVADVWQHGSIIASGLNELIAGIYRENPKFDGIEGYVAQSGEGVWTSEVADASGVPMPALEAALNTRAASEAGHVNHATKLLAALRNAFGGHNLNRGSK